MEYLPGKAEVLVSEYGSVDGTKHKILILILRETPDEDKPCFYRRLGLPGGACIRQGNVDRVITLSEMRGFIRSSSVFRYDLTMAVDTLVEDLDSRKILDYLERSAIRAGRQMNTKSYSLDQLKNLKIVGEFNGIKAPTVAGYLVFSKEKPQYNGLYCRLTIRCVRYTGITSGSLIIDKQEVDGTLNEQIDLVLKFILRNISTRVDIVGPKRVETPEYPEDALRELVANAVIHRDYELIETYTQVAVYSNRIEISNPGGLPPGVTVENIAKSQKSRNVAIAGLLKGLDYLEEFGRGIDLVCTSMENAGLMWPIFENDLNSFKVILVGDGSRGLNSRQIKILGYLREKGRATTKELEVELSGTSHRTLNRDLQGLIALGYVGQEGYSISAFYRPIF